MKLKDQVTKDNRKAFIPFLIIMAVSLVLGGVLGFAVISILDSGMELTVQEVLYEAFGRISGGLTVAASLICLLVAVFYFRKAKGLLADWDGEDDAVYQRGDALLSRGLLASSVGQILTFLFFGVAMALFYSLLNLVLALVGMVLTIVWVMRYQQLAVDLVRRMNPEKQGSVYDVNFQKKWLNSCDEAERQQIGEASTFAFQTVNGLVCPVLWGITFFAAMLFDCGPLPILSVSLVWLSLTVLYQWKCIQLSEKKLKSL